MPGTFVDENFNGAGETPGLEIWRIEVWFFIYVSFCFGVNLDGKILRFRNNFRNIFCRGKFSDAKKFVTFA